MHLIQAANTLSAEIELGAAATIRRVRNGHEITDAQELILCSALRRARPQQRSVHRRAGQCAGAAEGRHHDQQSGRPLLHEFNPVGWTTPDGEDPRKFWKFVRGKDDHFVRAVFEVPPGRGYVVGRHQDRRQADRLRRPDRRFHHHQARRPGDAHRRRARSRRSRAAAARPAACRRRGAAVGDRRAAGPAAPQPESAPRGSGTSRPPQLAAAWAAVERRRSRRSSRGCRRRCAGSSSSTSRTTAAAPPALLPYPKLPEAEFKTRLVIRQDHGLCLTGFHLRCDQEASRQRTAFHRHRHLRFQRRLHEGAPQEGHAARRNGVTDAGYQSRRRPEPVRGVDEAGGELRQGAVVARPAIRSPTSATRTRRSSSSTARSS